VYADSLIQIVQADVLDNAPPTHKGVLMPDTQTSPRRPIQVGGYGYICAVLCAVLLLSASLASAQFTYQTIVPKLPQVPVIKNSRVTGFTDAGIMVGLYEDPNGRWGSWLYRPSKKTYTKVVQPGWTLLIEDVDGQLKMVGTGWKNNNPHGIMKWGNGSSLFKVIKSFHGEETEHCSLAGNDYAICIYYDEALQMNRGVLWNSAGFPVAPPIDLDVSNIDIDNYWWWIMGVDNSSPFDLAGGVIYSPSDTEQRSDGFLVIDGVTRLVAAPNCSEVSEEHGTVVNDLADGGLAAVTCLHTPSDIRYAVSYAYNSLEETWTPLMLPRSRETVVRRVNNLGQYAGYYVDADWSEKGFIATPIP
jgi:hypothetical protein